mmetsp:Transcript_30514/g.72234  ORF Transcript_30514/g.72234 Transcript_30514/m.72234 type:complete len:440 (+) Transcript_30514:19-1338(+)
MTGDQWGDIARALFVMTDNGPLVACFFVSYQLLVALVLVNVVIAVLLEEFAKAAAAEKETGKVGTIERGDKAAFAERCVLERLVLELQVFSDAEEFEEKIHLMYLRLTQAAGLFNGEMERLDMSTFILGMRKYGMVPPITFTEDDWTRLVVGEGLMAADGTIGFMEFGILIRQAFRRNQLRDLTYVMETEPTCWGRTTVHAAMMSVKCILLDRAYLDDSIYAVPVAEEDLDIERVLEEGSVQGFTSPGADTIRAQAEKLAEELDTMKARLTRVEAELLGQLETPRARSRSVGDEDKLKQSEVQNLFQTNFFNLFTPTQSSSHANGASATEPRIARTRSDPEEGRLTARRRHSAATPTGKANGWNFLAAATANPFDVKDGLLGGFGAVGKAFPFLNTTPQANGTKTAGSSPANTPPISPRAGGATPVIEISSWRPARARK